MYLTSQLTDISSRFPAHVEEVRAFLLKEKLPVPSPEAIPEVAARLESDARFRADVGSLLRAALYRERERVGHEELLGILVTAAAGTKHDLSGEAEAAAIREMLRFVLQSRRATFRMDAVEESDSAEPEVREPVAVGAAVGKAGVMDAEPVLARRLRSRLDAAAEPVQTRSRLKPEPVKDEPRLVEDSAVFAKAKVERRERVDGEPDDGERGDLVLPARTSGLLFAAHTEPQAAWWRAHPAWIAGVVCMMLGVGLGMVMHRVVSAAEMHAGMHLASSSNKAKPASAVVANGAMKSAPGTADAADLRSGSRAQPAMRANGGADITEAPVGTLQTGSVDKPKAGSPMAPMEGRATPPPVGTPAATTAGRSSAVPVTVVKQVVTASPSGPEDGSAGATQLRAATRSVVHPGSAGMTAANVIFSPAPVYPPAAAAARVHGQVTVHAVVDPDGNVIYARAVSGPAALRDAAQEAVHKWRYRPVLDNGKPIAVTTVAILDFKVAK